MIRMYRYSEGENSYILIDGRDVEIPRFRKSGTVHSLCLFHNVNGIGILDKSDKADFSLEFYGSDGMPHAMPADAIAGASDTVTGAAVCAVAFAVVLLIPLGKLSELRLPVIGCFPVHL